MLQGHDLKQAVETALYKAEELLKVGWCRTWALNKEGKSVDPTDESACAFCLEGALIAATKLVYDPEDAVQIQQYAVVLIQSANKEFIPAQLTNKHGTTKITNNSVIPLLNDRAVSSQEEVIMWIRKARKLAEMAKWS